MGILLVSEWQARQRINTYPSFVLIEYGSGSSFELQEHHKVYKAYVRMSRIKNKQYVKCDDLLKSVATMWLLWRRHLGIISRREQLIWVIAPVFFFSLAGIFIV